jgi:ABC-2 type transport system ATP-binding protein
VQRRGKQARMLIGYVPQELGFYDDLGVAEAVGFFARLNGVAHTDTGRTLDDVGLTGHGRKRIRELSGGMKQRLALAIALLGDPPVLVLDEVTASLDAVGREEFVAMLGRLRSTGRTILFASHRAEEIAALAGRVVLLERGRIVRTAPRDEFLAGSDRGSELHLVIGAEMRDRAMRCLEDSGFAPRLNGVGVYVPVDPDRKAAPFRILAGDRIPVDDFELVPGAPARGHSEGATP